MQAASLHQDVNCELAARSTSEAGLVPPFVFGDQQELSTKPHEAEAFVQFRVISWIVRLVGTQTKLRYHGSSPDMKRGSA